jgi:hypothetical protein
MQVGVNRTRFGVGVKRSGRHPRDRLEHYGVMNGVGRTDSPAERCVPANQNPGVVKRIESLKTLHDRAPRIELVVGANLLLGKRFCHGNGTPEIVRMCRSEAWDRAARLSPRCGRR